MRGAKRYVCARARRQPVWEGPPRRTGVRGAAGGIGVSPDSVAYSYEYQYAMRANQNPGGGSGSADRTQVTGSRGRDPLAPNLNVPTDTGRISTKPWPVTSDGCHGHCHIDRRVGWVQPQQTRCNSGIHGARRGGSKWRSAVSCGQRLCEVRLGYQDDLGLRSGCNPPDLKRPGRLPHQRRVTPVGGPGTRVRTCKAGIEANMTVRMVMQRIRWGGMEVAPGLVPWRGKGRSGTGVFAWCLSDLWRV